MELLLKFNELERLSGALIPIGARAWNLLLWWQGQVKFDAGLVHAGQGVRNMQIPDNGFRAVMRNPFVNFLSRLSVGRKLVVIYLLDLTAVIFVSSILINEKYIAINFARDEFRGNAYAAAIREGLVDLALAGTGAAAEARRQLPSRAQALVEVEQRLGEDMNTQQLNATLVKNLGEVAADASNGLDAIGVALAHGRELVTRVGNQSKLILDPDLDSYYTMSLIVLRYPELLDLVHGIGTHLRRGARARTVEGRTQYLILEGKIDAAIKGIESDFSEAVAAGSEAMKADMTPSQRKLMACFDAFRRAARDVNEGAAGAAALAALDSAQRDLLWQLRETWAGSGQVLDGLLNSRIDGLFARMWQHLGTALMLLMVILTIVYFVARQIIVPLRRLSSVVDTVSRTGDHSLRARWISQDEIGRLVLAFNDMLGELDRERELQKELAASARAAEAQKALVEAMPIPIVVTSVPGHDLLHANKPAQEWLVGCKSDPWAVGLEPGVRARFFQQLADHDAVDEFEVHWKAGKDPAWALLSARRLTYQGQNAVLTAFGPINRLKSMEQRLELWAKVFEASSEGIMIVHADERILSVNRAFVNSTGYNAGEVTGKPPDFLVVSAAEKPFFGALWARVRRRGAWQGEVLMRRQDGSEFPAWLMVSAVYESHGKVAYYICTSIDITDRKQMESFRTAKEAAEAASRAKSEFVANMSHELRTPLNGILGMTELLQDSGLTATQRHYAQTVKSSGEALLHIINDILDFSKIEAGKMDIETIDLDVRQTTEEVVDLLAARAQDKGLELLFQIDENVPAVVAGDPGRLRQVLVNLVGNAVKFTEHGEVALTVNCVSAAAKSCVLRFAVRDTGIGISESEHARLFKAFSQADGSMTRRFGGTGLGLMISKQLISLMGGDIGVESTPGRGSTFWFTLKADILEGRLPKVPRASLNGIRVLIVDDNATNRAILLHQIGAMGGGCELAADGMAGLAALRAAEVLGRPFQVALIDRNMPNMDGLELIRTIRSEPSLAGTRLAMLTSQSEASEGAASRSAGADAYLTKPVRRSDLMNVLAGLTGAFVLEPSEDQDAGAGAEDAADFHGARVLLAEDSAVNREIARIMLEKVGCHVTVARDGREAVAKSMEFPFELVLMDCQMPELDGFEATREIRAREAGMARVPILALTANAMEGDRERCIDAGMDDYLSKPFKREDLIAAMRRWIKPAPRHFDGSVVLEPEPARPRLSGPDAASAAHAVHPAFDLEAMKKIHEDPGGLNSSLLRDLVRLFSVEAEALLGEVERAGAAADPKALSRMAHTLKSSSALVGAVAISGVARELEQLARAGREEAFDGYLPRLRAEFQRFCSDPSIRAVLSAGSISS